LGQSGHIVFICTQSNTFIIGAVGGGLVGLVAKLAVYRLVSAVVGLLSISIAQSPRNGLLCRF